LLTPITLFHNVVEYFALQHLPNGSSGVFDVSHYNCHVKMGASFDSAFEDVWDALENLSDGQISLACKNIVNRDNKIIR
jgi:hypothetical protein